MLFYESELIYNIIIWLLETRSLYLYRSYEALCCHKLTVKKLSINFQLDKQSCLQAIKFKVKEEGKVLTNVKTYLNMITKTIVL